MQLIMLKYMIYIFGLAMQEVVLTALFKLV